MGGSKSDQVIFISGSTEANNLAMMGLLPESPPPGGNLILSSLEHPSVSAMAGFLMQQGWQVYSIDAQFDGTVCLEQLEGRLNAQTKLVSLVLANNETGGPGPGGDCLFHRFCMCSWGQLSIAGPHGHGLHQGGH